MDNNKNKSMSLKAFGVARPALILLKAVLGGIFVPDAVVHFSAGWVNIAWIQEFVVAIFFIALSVDSLDVYTHGIKDLVVERIMSLRKGIIVAFIIFLLFLILFIIAHHNLTCSWRGKSYIIGYTFTENVQEKDRQLPPNELMQRSSGAVELIWERSSIMRAFIIVFSTWILVSVFATLLVYLATKLVSDKALLSLHPKE